MERDRYRPLDLWVRHGRDEVRFDIKERYRQVRRNLTDAEKADRWNAGREWTQVREASGELTLKITTYGPEGIQTSWKDDASGRLEEKLQSAVVGFLVVAAYAKHRRELNEAEEHRRWEAQRAAWQLEEQKKAERARQDALVRDAENWRKAKLVRDYVEAANAACSARLGEPEVANLRAWSEWALGHAERLDPIAGGRAGRMEA